MRCVFAHPEAAQEALDEMIQLGISPQRIAFRARFADPRELEEVPALSVHSAIEAAWLSERIMASPSATGFNLAGNSTLSGTSLGDFGQILAEVAGSESRRSGVRIDALIRTMNRQEAQNIEGVLRRYGGEKIRTTATGY